MEKNAQVLSKTGCVRVSYGDASSNVNTNYYKYYKQEYLPSDGGKLPGTECS